MTPLWGTKNPSAPVGDKSGGERRAGRAAAFQVFTKPEIRDPKHGLYAFHESQLPYPRFPTISHHFPRFPGISRPPPPPPPIKCPRAVRLSWSAARDCRPRPVAAFLRVAERHGAAMARHGRHGAPRAAVRAPSAPATGPFGFSRNTRPETRDTAIVWRAAQASANSEVFTKHETRNTNHGFFSKHGFFLACFGGRVVRNAG